MLRRARPGRSNARKLRFIRTRHLTFVTGSERGRARRAHVVRYGHPAPDVNARACEPSPRAAGTPGAWTWAALMRRVFALDVLACPRCGGRLWLIATVENPAVVATILAHPGLLHAPHSPGPAPPSAALRAATPSRQ